MAALLLYALAYPYVGEGLYKVWAQETIGPASRATFQGATIAGARAVAALFALATPWLLAHDPALLFWLLAVIASATVLGAGNGVPPKSSGCAGTAEVGRSNRVCPRGSLHAADEDP